MTGVLPGEHHCAGMARSTIEHVFQLLNAKCIAEGGVLSSHHLKRAKIDIFSGLTSDFNFIETAHKHCMSVSNAIGPHIFSRNEILATALYAAFAEPASQVFNVELRCLGPRWLQGFFAKFAEYVKSNICPTASEQLISAYAAIAVKYGTAMTITDFVSDHSVRNVLQYCLKPLVDAGAAEQAPAILAEGVQFEIYNKTTTITADQIRGFLALLRPLLIL